MSTLVEKLGSDHPELKQYTIPGPYKALSATPISDMKPVVDVYTSFEEEKFQWDEGDEINEWLQQNAPNAGEVAFVVHGFTDGEDAQWMIDMKDALLSRLSVVALVGWKKGADYMPIFYDWAVANVKGVGEWLGGIVSGIKRQNPTINIHGIGHSLGAHVMGFAGRTSRAFTRITGLDPAGPRFEMIIQGDRLKKTDATQMVDVIHTDGYAPSGYYPVNHFGTLIPLGTIDFYPNWGLAPQPGCEWYHIHDWKIGIGASHRRAYDLFTSSILNEDGFVTHSKLTHTPSYEHIEKTVTTVAAKAQMGYYADNEPGTKGNFYIETTDKAPWE